MCKTTSGGVIELRSGSRWVRIQSFEARATEVPSFSMPVLSSTDESSRQRQCFPFVRRARKRLRAAPPPSGRSNLNVVQPLTWRQFDSPYSGIEKAPANLASTLPLAPEQSYNIVRLLGDVERVVAFRGNG